ncbi:AMP-binding protein, partial [Chryseobacterium sp.]|uniref:AMP-binding protein n=1 Tax=Chryseobacterium sp. TaxID=1871047 RepID=UPI0031D4A103
MLNRSSLSNIFWLNKTKNKEIIFSPEDKILYTNTEISKKNLESFFRISKDNSKSKFTVITSVYYFLLKRYFDDFQNVVRITSSQEIELDNDVLLEVELDNNNTFKELLKKTADVIKESFEHCHYNSEDINLSEFSNFSIQFQYGTEEETLTDSVSLFYHEAEDSVFLGIYYKSEYSGYAVQSLLDNFTYILSNYDQYLDIEVHSYNFLLDQKSSDLLNQFNSTEVSYPTDKTIVSLFESQVDRSPSHTAVVFGDLSLSYWELNARSNQLAHYLISLYSIERDDLICIDLPRSEQMIIVILGILKSGGAYVPIDFDYPQDRKDYIIQDTHCRVVIDECFLSDFESQRDYYSTDNPVSLMSPDDLAYVIYTSGTTGHPKGVMIEHKAVFHSTLNRINFYSIESMLLIPSFSFDSSVAVIFGVLCSGGRLFVESTIHIKDVEHISNRIISHNINGLLCVPNYYFNLLPYLTGNASGSNTLEHVIVAGEELSKGLVSNHFKYSNAVLYNEYGPTECAVWSSVSIVNDDHITIGKPISNTQIYILDDYGHQVPIGVAGELYISGSGLARGYLNRE